MSEVVFIVGSGSREHCIAWKIAQSNSVAKVRVCPGNAGTAKSGNHKISNLGMLVNIILE